MPHRRRPDLQDQKIPNDQAAFSEKRSKRFERIKKVGAHSPTKMPNRSPCAWVSIACPPCEKPDGDRADNRGETEDEAEFAEKLVLSGFHTCKTNSSRRDQIAQWMISELARHLVVLGGKKGLMPQ